MNAFHDNKTSHQEEGPPRQTTPPNTYDPYTYHSGQPSGMEPLDVPQRHHQKQKKKRYWIALTAIGLCCSILGGALGAGGVLLMQYQTKDESHISQGKRPSTIIVQEDINTNSLMTPAEVYAANVNSTVGITTSVTTNFWGFQSTSAASGSGFIISDDGYILTNFHVIDNSDSITVSMFNNDTYDAELIGYDESNDIAVLKIEAEGLTPVILGDSENLNVGDSVVAIGNPLGELTFSLTSGTISAKDREITLSRNMTMNLLQTDCAINSGNSGGALFNLYGEVIGVTNAKYSSSAGGASIDNIGFAIPINSVMPIVESIIEKGYISKPYIGITVMDVSPDIQKYGVPAGAAVQGVAEDSPAAKAGICAGDVITAVNGQNVTSNDLVEKVAGASIGEKIELTIYRQGEILEMTVTVAEQVKPALKEEDKQPEKLGQFDVFPK